MTYLSIWQRICIFAWLDNAHTQHLLPTGTVAPYPWLPQTALNPALPTHAATPTNLPTTDRTISLIAKLTRHLNTGTTQTVHLFRTCFVLSALYTLPSIHAIIHCSEVETGTESHPEADWSPGLSDSNVYVLSTTPHCLLNWAYLWISILRRLLIDTV